MNTRKPVGSDVSPSVTRRSNTINQLFDEHGQHLGILVNGRFVQKLRHKRNQRGWKTRSRLAKTEQNKPKNLYYKIAPPYLPSKEQDPVHTEDIKVKDAINASHVAEALQQVINEATTKLKNSYLELKEIGGVPGKRTTIIDLVKDNSSRSYLAEVTYNKGANPFPIIFDDADEIQESLDSIEDLKDVVADWLEEFIEDRISAEYLITSSRI
ncbi:hypothetical protein [Saccharibacillus deserti]|uniref:hypothetical protein n=1 Tax=Saccharibacillus deserti TaxID=1634444 RepID=UPI001555815E|nr:hypothetical protein [Saccharibacillus deserti]